MPLPSTEVLPDSTALDLLAAFQAAEAVFRSQREAIEAVSWRANGCKPRPSTKLNGSKSWNVGIGTASLISWNRCPIEIMFKLI